MEAEAGAIRMICRHPKNEIRYIFTKNPAVLPPDFFIVRPAGRTFLRVKVPYAPGKGNPSPVCELLRAAGQTGEGQTARVSAVRRNLKEAAGKALV